MESAYLLRRRAMMLGQVQPDPPKPAKPIAKKSAKQISKDKQLRIIVRAKLKKNPFCQAKFPGCKKVGMHVHHGRGRGEYLLDEKTLKTLCDHCHHIAETQPEVAMKAKISSSRLSIDDISNDIS